MPLRTVIIGCGRIGSEAADDQARIGVYSHAGAYTACAATRLVAVCDRDPARARRCAQRWGGLPWYTDVAALLRAERPDLVSVCTPDATHEAVLRQVLAAPSVRGVLAEKPLAMRAAAARRLVQQARTRGVTLAVNYSRRYAASHARVRALLAAGRLGDIQAVTGYYGKGTLHNGTHWFDLVRWLFGEIVSVTGWKGADAETHGALLRFASGLTATLHPTDARAYALFELDVLGTRGRLRLTDFGQRVERSRVAPSAQYSGYRTLVPQPADTGALRDVTLHAVRDLARAVRTGGAPACTGEDGLAALQVAEAVVRSARTGRPVRLGAA